MAVGEVWKVNTHILHQGQHCQFGVHYRFKTALADPEDLLQDHQGAVEASVIASLGTDAELTHYTADQRSPGTAEGYERLLEPVPAGTGTSVGLPPQDSAVFSLHTGQKSRRRRGRFYFPAIPADQYLDGRIEAAQMNQYEGLAQALIVNFGPAGINADYELVTFSPEDLTADPARPGTIIQPVTRITVDNVVRSQRRRQIGVGT
jgi:hypothetical protein